MSSSTINFKISKNNCLNIKKFSPSDKVQVASIGPLFGKIKRKKVSYKQKGEVIIVNMPKKEKVKWKKLYRDENLVDFENLNFENLKISEKIVQKKQFVKANSSLKRISENEILAKKKPQNHPINKNQILKGFYENQQIQTLFTNFEKIKSKFKTPPRAKHTESQIFKMKKKSVLMAEKGHSRFEKFAKRYDHLPIFCNSARSKNRRKSGSTHHSRPKSSISKANEENRLKNSKSVSAWSPVFYVSEKKNVVKNRKKTKKKKSRRGSDKICWKKESSVEELKESETETFLVSELKALKTSRVQTKRNRIDSKRTFSYKRLSQRSCVKGIKKRPNSTKNLREKENGNLVKISTYKDVEFKRRQARLNKKIEKKSHPKLKMLKKKLKRKNSKKKKSKTNLKKIKLVRQFDKKDSIDTLDQTYGMVKLKIDSSREVNLELKNFSVEKLKKSQLTSNTPTISKKKIKNCLTPPDPEMSSFEPSLIHSRIENRKNSKENPKLGKMIKEEKEGRNISFKLREEATVIKNIPKFKFLSKEISPISNKDKLTLVHDKLLGILPDLEEKKLIQMIIGKKKDRVEFQSQLIWKLKSLLKQEQKDRLKCEKRLLKMLLKTEKKVEDLEKRMDGKAFKFSTPKKIMESIVGLDTEDVCLNMFRDKISEAGSGEEVSEEELDDAGEEEEDLDDAGEDEESKEEESKEEELDNSGFGEKLEIDEKKKFDCIKERYKMLLELDQF